MKIAVFDTHRYDREALEHSNEAFHFTFSFFDVRLKPETAALAQGHDVVCAFVNDQLTRPVLETLKQYGVRLIALRCAGFNNVDLKAAKELGLPVVRVPEYSPYAVAEHAVALLLTLNRKIHKAHNRVREGNFSLDGLVGFDLKGKTVGIVGTGKIGKVFTQIMNGFGCRLLAFDVRQDEALVKETGVEYVAMERVFAESDVISLHVPLMPQTYHLVNEAALALMKPGVVLINTSRGALVDAAALIKALKQGRIGAAGLDVYEEEAGVFFQDLSGHVLQDDVLARLLTFPNVIITSHQAFLTKEALGNIAETTLGNVKEFRDGKGLRNEVK
jgi:D-lactate dehydrogenase